MKSIAKFAPYILSVFIAVLSFISGSTTDIGQSVAIALDKDKAVAQAAQIINATPLAEIKQAIKSTDTSTAVPASDVDASTVPDLIDKE